MDTRRLWAAALFLFVIGHGIVTQIWGALLPRIRDSFTVSDTLLGFVTPAGTVGYLVAAVAVGFAAHRIGTFDGCSARSTRSNRNGLPASVGRIVRLAV